MNNILSKLYKLFSIRSKDKSYLKMLDAIVAEINLLESDISRLSNNEISDYSRRLKLRALDSGDSLEKILPEAFALVREASKRTLGLRHFDVQLAAGIVLHWGNIAELKTGEGKTLVAPLAAYLNSLPGKKVHVISMNDYLVKRDSEWMKPIYSLLGLSVGCIDSFTEEEQKKEEYSKDIVYVTNNERAFDYLRDNMKFSRSQMHSIDQFDYCIIDEADSILIDEGRTPLIISGPNNENSPFLYKRIKKAIDKLTPEKDYEMDEKHKAICFTESGQINIESIMIKEGLLEAHETLYDVKNAHILNIVIQSLKAKNFFQNGVHYMVVDNSVAIVDEFTGRVDKSRRYGEGLHQALEAKEGLNIKAENKTLASISYQNFFRLYRKISGMTGTAKTEEKELKEIYNLNVVQIPTNKKILRTDHSDLIYMTSVHKFDAIVNKIIEIHAKGQPILVGTVSIEKSEFLSRKLKEKNLKHNVLNAKNHEQESLIISQAGKLGAITIATNMAGRGTDIKLGGNIELDLQNCTSNEERSKITAEHAKNKEAVLRAGGLYIIGTERHENRRIDNQLIGRSGRQGDPGESQFYLSMDDDLLRIFGGERIASIMDRFGGKAKRDEPMKHGLLDKAVKNAQKRVEDFHAQMRKGILRYDDIQNKQRLIICEQRMNFIDVQSPISIAIQMIKDINEDILSDNKNSKELLRFAFHEIYNLNIPDGNTLSGLNEYVIDILKKRMSLLPEDHASELIREVFISILDQEWELYLNFIEDMKDGIQLRSYANKDPFVEFQNESYQLFGELLKNIVKRSLEILFRVKIDKQPDPLSFVQKA